MSGRRLRDALQPARRLRHIRRPRRSLWRRIERLTEGASRLAAGSFDQRVPVEGDDEIAQLAQAFNSMAGQLQTSYRSLEERVTERTRALETSLQISRRLSTILDQETLTQEVVDEVQRAYNYYHVHIYLFDLGRQYLLMVGGTGEAGRAMLLRGHRLKAGQGLVGRAASCNEITLVPDVREAPDWLPNPLLPDTKSELAVPITFDGKVQGVLDVQHNVVGGLDSGDVDLLQTIAAQLAVGLQNAQLLTQVQTRAERAARINTISQRIQHTTSVEQALQVTVRELGGALPVSSAYIELEAQSQSRINETWQAFLNAIDRPERLVYCYAGGIVSAEPKLNVIDAVGENSLNAPLEVKNELIGHVRLKPQPQQHWMPQDLELLEAVAAVVAQQVENLRLLAEAEHYREEAEKALRRFTREQWEEPDAGPGGYLYDGRLVTPLLIDDGVHDIARPLLVRGERVGELMVDVDGLSPANEAAELVSAVAARLSAHVENLRLSRQTEIALADVQRRSDELAHLNRVVTRIAATLDLRNSLQIVVEELVAVTAADQARIGLLNGERSALKIVSEQFDESRSPSALGLEIPVEGNALTQEVLSTARPVVIRDAQNHPLTAPIRGMLYEQGIQTMIVLPIMAGNEIIGTVGADILSMDVDFGAEDLRLAEMVVFQAATAIQNARLFEQVQTTLAETRALYRASAELNRARSYDDLLDVLRLHSVAGEDSNMLSLTLFDVPWTDSTTPEWINVLAHWSPHPVQNPTVRFSLQDYPALKIMERDRQAMIEDVATDSRLDSRSRRALLNAFRARAVLAMPLVAGGQWIGHVNVMYPEPRNFSESELQQLRNLVGQAAVAVQSINLLKETQARAQRERVLREITARVRSVTDIDVIMKTAVREVSRALERDAFVMLGEASSNGENETEQAG